MGAQILNYRIIVEPDTRTGTEEPCYTAVCPTLVISDSGDTIEEAVANLKQAINVWVESLVEDGEAVPVDHIEDSMVTFTSVRAPSNLRLAL